ncbi:hypothetical protein ONZ51_g5757 [Trametes cubensis]|uniref:RNase III domain-containing protein n=1 Tax=Trametes cubensis TaxID=1111947 RepID=A0AAD7TVU5_9APHY|nr:hypothetical protein ONZ51_g5757 [Trametes cubensis]
MPIPTAPALPGDALLEIFVHPASIPANQQTDPNNKFSDGRRLAFLGQKMTELAYMDAMSEKWPNVQAIQLQTLVNSTIHGFMEKCVNAYRWKERVRGFPQNVDILHDHEEAYRLFRAYAGAVYVEHGYDILKSWIKDLTLL